MSAPDRQWSTRVEPITCPREYRYLTDGDRDALLEEYETTGKSLGQLAEEHGLDRTYLAGVLEAHSNPFVGSSK